MPSKVSSLRRFAGRRNGPTEAEEPTTDPAPHETESAPIATIRPRERVTVVGEVRTVSLRPLVEVPALDVELWDGTGSVHLVWLGRRSIVGIVTGLQLRATGRVTEHRRAPTIFNPAYEILGREGESHG